jgi:acylphosphatase
MGNGLIRVQTQYSGDVQGVGFRATTRGIAQLWRVRGWVRNEPDGSVLLEAQGEPDQVNGFLRAITRELSQRIDTCARHDCGLCEGETEFVIRY